jgi:hypothetical protein
MLFPSSPRLLGFIDRHPSLEPVRLEPDTVSGLPYPALALRSDLTWIAKPEVGAGADIAVEQVQVFVPAAIATDHVEDEGSIAWAVTTVAQC